MISLAYVVQIQSATWYVKFSDRIFGKVPEEEEKPSPPSPAPEKEVLSAGKLTNDLFFVNGASIVPDIKKTDA